MERGACIGVALVVAIGGLAGCAHQVPLVTRVTPGLANVPALPAPWNERLDIHDVIANANDSCPRASAPVGDPLRFRYPRCPAIEATRASDVVLTSDLALPAEPKNGLWNVHLRGLPPCDGPQAARVNALGLALCRAD